MIKNLNDIPADVESMVYSFISDKPLTFASVDEMRTALGFMEQWNNMILPILEDPERIVKIELHYRIPYASELLISRLKDPDFDWQNRDLFNFQDVLYSGNVQTYIQQDLRHNHI